MINFIQDNRFSLFLDKLASVAQTEKSTSYVDLSPNGVFDGAPGTLLVKNGKDIMFKMNTDEAFTNLSSLFPYVVAPREYLLSRGINVYATWVKIGSVELKTWQFLGYTCPFNGPCMSCPVMYYPT